MRWMTRSMPWALKLGEDDVTGEYVGGCNHTVMAQLTVINGIINPKTEVIYIYQYNSL